MCRRQNTNLKTSTRSCLIFPRFLEEAEDGYKTVCDDLKEAEISLDKRKQMLVELERELREYNLKSFINTGFTEKRKFLYLVTC